MNWDIVCAYIALIVTIVLLVQKWSGITNKYVKLVIKLFSVFFLLTAMIYTYHVVIFPEIIVVGSEALLLGSLLGNFLRKGYKECYADIRDKMENSSFFVDFWRPWVGHAVIMPTFIVFMFLLVSFVSLFNEVIGAIIVSLVSTLVVFLVVLILVLSCYLVYTIVECLIQWIKKQ